MLDLSLAIGHHLLIFMLFGVLIVELVLVRSSLDRSAIVRTARIDLWYGIIAGSIVVLGFTRAIFAAKGWNYYEHNIFFWAKIGTFALVALLSVPPTINYLRWQRAGSVPSDSEINVVRRFLWAEVALFALLPIFAAAMARGYGETGLPERAASNAKPVIGDASILRKHEVAVAKEAQAPVMTASPRP